MKYSINNFEVNGNIVSYDDPLLKKIISIKRNLYNKNTSADGKYLYIDGSLYDNADYTTSDFIPVEENQNYIYNVFITGVTTFRYINYYDSNKNVISQEQTNNRILTPPNTSYIRLSLYISTKDYSMLELGTISNDTYIPYDKPIYSYIYDYIPEIDEHKIKDNSVTVNKLSSDALQNTWTYYKDAIITSTGEHHINLYIVKNTDTVKLIFNDTSNISYIAYFNGYEYIYIYDFDNIIINTHSNIAMRIFPKKYNEEFNNNFRAMIYTNISLHEYFLDNSLKYNNRRFHGTATDYKTIVDDIILKNTRITNNGEIPIGFFNAYTSDNSDMRLDIQPGKTGILTFDAKIVKSLNVAGSYDFYLEYNYISEQSISNNFIKDNDIEANVKIKNNTITPNKLLDYSISMNKLSFTESFNIYDYDSDNEKIDGKYITQNNSFGTNELYMTTGYIRIKPNTQYTHCKPAPYRFILQYDSDLNPLTLINNNNISHSFVSDETAVFMRASFLKAYETKIMICEGSEPVLTYVPYKSYIPSKYIQLNDSQNIQFYLPKHIYCAVGRTIELYYDLIILNSHKYNIQAKCNIGKSLERKFQIIGSSNIIGDYTLSINLYDDSNNLLSSKTSTVHIVNNLTNNVQLLPIGDSLTNQKPWITELKTLSNNLITTVGTRSKTNSHEGRSGGSASFYINTSGNASYSYDNSYNSVGSDAQDFSTSTTYKVGDYCKKDFTFGIGISKAVYVFTKEHTGEWSDDDVYCLSTGNPFYDYTNKCFSMNFYKSKHNISYNAIFIYLGTNGISLTPETNNNGSLGIKTLIDNIRTEDTSTPIIVINTIFKSGQNGIGNLGNTDGYSSKQSSYKFEEDLKVLKLAQSLDEMISNMDNVYICPVGFTHDSLYNFGYNKVPVNPRITNTDDVYEINPNESVHPLTCGYYQMADEMYSTLCAIFN